jgi:hypothetical protein
MANQQPMYRAYSVIKREGQDDFWLPIGTAFAHHDGVGFNVILQALPIPAGDSPYKIVLRPLKTDDEQDSNLSAKFTSKKTASGASGISPQPLV